MRNAAAGNRAGQGLDHLGNGIHGDTYCKRGGADLSDITPASLVRPLGSQSFPQPKPKHYSIIKVQITVKLSGKLEERRLKFFFQESEADAPVGGVERNNSSKNYEGLRKTKMNYFEHYVKL